MKFARPHVPIARLFCSSALTECFKLYRDAEGNPYHQPCHTPLNGLKATFNLSLAEAMGSTIGVEARAMNNMHGCRARGGGGCGWGNGNWYIGLNVWVPNLNIYRARSSL
jgi:hypothetical protein